jgi:hypothetical protein
MPNVIDLERMENAMFYLSETDDKYALAKADLLRTEILAKRVRAKIFLSGSGSVEARKAEAEGHGEVITVDDALVEATVTFETLKARRSRAEILIDVYRTLEASRRKT